MSDPLLAAARAGDLADVRERLAAGADREARDADGATALMLAAHAGWLDVVRALIDAGADVNATDDRGAKQGPGRPHDCRRTIATGLSEMGVAPHVVEHALGHAMPRVLATYNKHDYLAEQRVALHAWAEHLDDVIAGKTAKVVSIRAVVRS